MNFLRKIQLFFVSVSFCTQNILTVDGLVICLWPKNFPVKSRIYSMKKFRSDSLQYSSHLSWNWNLLQKLCRSYLCVWGMVFQKGDKGERIEQVAIRGLFEKQHVILDRKLWDKAFKARAPPIYLPYFLTGEQLAKYPESRRVWFCGAHSLFVPILKEVEFIKLEKGEDWPAGADVPSRYAANPVPAPTLFITGRSKKKTTIVTDQVTDNTFCFRYQRFAYTDFVHFRIFLKRNLVPENMDFHYLTTGHCRS